MPRGKSASQSSSKRTRLMSTVVPPRMEPEPSDRVTVRMSPGFGKFWLAAYPRPTSAWQVIGWADASDARLATKAVSSAPSLTLHRMCPSSQETRHTPCGEQSRDLLTRLRNVAVSDARLWDSRHFFFRDLECTST